MRWQETTRGGTIYYPIWLSYATGLLDEKYHTKLVDAPAQNLSLDNVVQDVSRFNPDVIVIDSNFTSWKNDLNVAKRLKSILQDRFFIIVGPHTSVYYKKIMKYPYIDAVIRGEYDFNLWGLVDSLDEGLNLRGTNGVSYKEENEIIHNPIISSHQHIDKLPFVSKTYKKHLNINNYFLSSALYPEVQILTGRGCPYSCTFCAWPQTFTGKKNRVRSVNNVIKEMLWIKNNLPIKEIVFEDDTFGLNKNWLREFCERIIEEDINIPWSAQVRVNIDSNLFPLMKKAGCRLLIVGFESGNDNILKNVRKGIIVEQSKYFGRKIKEAGILLHGDFIVGLPGETWDTIEDTRQLISEIKPEILQISIATPFPGTEFYSWAKKEKYLVYDDPSEYLDNFGHQKSIINYPEISTIDMKKTVDRMLKDYYLSPSYVQLAIKQIWRRNGFEEMKRLIRSVLSFKHYITNSHL